MAAELSERARAFLREKHFAVLGTINADGTPHLTTIWYLLEDDGTILMNTRAGRVKDRHMRRVPRISVIFRAKLKQTASGLDVVTSQIRRVYSIGA